LVGRLGGWFEVDLVAECFELADVFAFLAVGLDAAVVEAWAEVGELGAGIGEQVPGDGEYGSADGDDCFLFASSACQAPVDNASRDAQPFPVVNPDGTITFTDTLTGMPLRVYTAHSNTLVKDVGFLSFVDTFDAQGNFLSQQVIEHGPHPFGGDFTVFCDAIASAIG
jgi:hypothetical protein